MKKVLCFLRESGATGVTLRLPFFEFSMSFREDADEDAAPAVGMGFRMEEDTDEDE